MKESFCLCGPKRFFSEYICYRHETVFAPYEGTVIGKCVLCGLLKTFPNIDIFRFNPMQSRARMYEKDIDFYMKLFEPIAKTVRRNTAGKKVLDVGCSSGILMSCFREKGYLVWGIEPNKEAMLVAKKRFRDNVFFGTSKEFLRKKKEMFDVVIYNHVLEHIEDVLGELRRAKKLLKPGGLLIVGVPNTRNVIFFIRKKYWEPLMPNEHIWHFSDMYMIHMLKKNGFSIEEVSYENDMRKDYPRLKRVYFGSLSWINRMSKTGEAVLITARYIKKT